MRALQRILRNAGRQSANVVIDIRRAKGMSDALAAKELRHLMPLVKSVRRLTLVTKSSDVIDIC